MTPHAIVRWGFATTDLGVLHYGRPALDVAAWLAGVS